MLAGVLAAMMLAGSCFAASVLEKQNDVEVAVPTALALSDATGATLSAAQEDIAELQAHVQVCGSDLVPALENSDTVMIYDCGTQTVGDYDVSTTIYTFDVERTTASSGKSDGISVHTYTQSGFVRFKVYFMLYFSFDGTNVSPIWDENETWTNSSDAILSCGTPSDSYDRAGTCTATWKYTINYGTSIIKNKTATLSCTTAGIVTYEEKTIPFT